jgi:hypothetical protein
VYSANEQHAPECSKKERFSVEKKRWYPLWGQEHEVKEERFSGGRSRIDWKPVIYPMPKLEKDLPGSTHIVQVP